MGDELLPCPFCGLDAEVKTHGLVCVVECTNCGNQTERYIGGEAEAIAAWNRRAEPEQVGGLHGLLRRLRRGIELAIYYDDGLDGGDGEKLLQEIDTALEASAQPGEDDAGTGEK